MPRNGIFCQLNKKTGMSGSPVLHTTYCYMSPDIFHDEVLLRPGRGHDENYELQYFPCKQFVDSRQAPTLTDFTNIFMCDA